MDYLILLSSIALGVITVFWLRLNDPKHVKVLNAFTGAYLLSLVMLHLLPDLYAPEPGIVLKPLVIGAFILFGFFLQIALDAISMGIEHGHAHEIRGRMAIGILAGLCMHAFVEALALGQSPEHQTAHDLAAHHFLLVSVVVHNYPISIALLGMLLQSGMKRSSALACLGLNYPGSLEKSKAVSLLKDFNLSDENINNLIGVILPVYQNDKNNNLIEPSIEILEGIKFAVSEYNNENYSKIGLLIRDSERKTEKIKNIKEEFDKINSIKAIIGPVYSDEVKTALEIFRNSNIPIISPTATDNDLASSYPNFFQANPSFILRGKIMAQYIYFVENKKKMAILSPDDGYSSSVANAFKNEFTRLGGKIILEVTYSSNSYDLNSQISKIQVRIKEIEGLYVPLSDKAEASVILSQLEQQGINLTLYGNQDWLLAKGFESSSTLSNQLIFTSDYFIDYDDFNYQAFNKAFHQKTGMDAT